MPTQTTQKNSGEKIRKVEWKRVKLGEVLEKIVGGGTPSKANLDYWGGSIPWASVKDTTDGVFYLSSTKDSITEDGLKNSASNLIPRGTVILPTRMGLGRVFVNKIDVAINQDLKAVFPNEKIDKNFLLWLINFISPEIVSMGSGSTVMGIRIEQLQNIEINLPPLSEQKKIAEVLSAYDDLIEVNQKKIKTLETLAQTLYKEWFVKPTKDGLPDGWEVKKVEDLIERVSVGKKYDNKTALSVGNVPILDQGKSGVIGYHNDEPGINASTENPVIVFANHTCYQNLIMFPFSAIQNVLPFYPSKENYRNIFWLHFATKDLISFNDYKGHWPEFSAKKVDLPPVDLCEKFGEHVKEMMIEKYNLEKQNQNLQKTRDILIPQLVGGRVEVK